MMKKVGKRLVSWSIRTQLIILVLVAVVPALLIILINGFELKNSRVREAHTRSMSAVKNLAVQQAQISDSTRQILNTLARIPQVQKGDAAACNAIFRDLISQNPAYLVFSIANPDGIVFASSHPLKKYSVADRRFFREAVRRKKFSVGEYVISRATNLPTLHFAYPIKTETGRIQAVLIAALNLNVYKQWLSDEFYVDGYVMGLTDHKGIRLYRYPDTESDITGVGVVVSDVSLRHFLSSLILPCIGIQSRKSIIRPSERLGTSFSGKHSLRTCPLAIAIYPQRPPFYAMRTARSPLP
jgi:hypothetical protein